MGRKRELIYRSQCFKCRCKIEHCKRTDEFRENEWVANIKHKYNLTKIDYHKILLKQKNRCAICKTDTNGALKRRFVVDHCHKTGRIRGWLCNRCNAALSAVGDNLENISKYVKYLRKIGDARDV